MERSSEKGKKMRLILASGSERRRQLMDMCGYDYEIIVSNADESIKISDPKVYVETLAERKASEVFNRLKAENKAESENKTGAEARKTAVIGSDTVVELDGEIIGKPKNREDAIRIISMLSGRTHTVYTGLAVITEENEQLDCAVTCVTVKKMTDKEIENYVDTGEPFDKAGAYGIQGPFGLFVESVEGNYFTIIGLPLPLLYDMLKNIGITPNMRRV